MTKFAKALKKFVKDLQKKHPHVDRSFTLDVKSISVNQFLTICNEDMENFIQKSNEFITKNPLATKKLDLSILLSEDVSEKVRSMVWTYLQSMYVYAFYDTHTKSEVETFLQRFGKEDIPSYVKTEWANVARVYKSVYGKNDERLMNTPSQVSQAIPSMATAMGLPSGGNAIQALATDLAKDLQNDTEFSDLIQSKKGMDLMNSVLKGENNPMVQQLFAKVSGRINEKIMNNEVDKDAIVKEASAMMSNPALNNMINSVIPSMKSSKR